MKTEKYLGYTLQINFDKTVKIFGYNRWQSLIKVAKNIIEAKSFINKKEGK